MKIEETAAEISALRIDFELLDLLLKQSFEKEIEGEESRDMENENQKNITRRRTKCSNCSRYQKIYCCYCCIAINHEAPCVKLPLNLHIYRHAGEKPQVSTTVYSKIVAQETAIYDYASFSSRNKSKAEQDSHSQNILLELQNRYPDPSKVLLLYPANDSVSLEELDQKDFDTLAVIGIFPFYYPWNPQINLLKIFLTILFIDGTWSQAKGMAKEFGKMGFRHIRIKNHQTMFWRYQSLDLTYLATIEAIYWFFVEFYTNFETGSNKSDRQLAKYDGKYDNLLFYFVWKWKNIQEFYKRNPKKRFTKKHALAETFIKYD